MTDVLHELASDPYGEEDAHHLLARDEAVFPVVSDFIARVTWHGVALLRRAWAAAVDELPGLPCPSSDAAGLNFTVACLDKGIVDTVVLAEDFERRLLGQVAARRPGFLIVYWDIWVVDLVAGLVEGLTDESKPFGSRLVVLHHQHIPCI